MKTTERTKKFVLSFIISILIFSLAFLIVSLGLSSGRDNERSGFKNDPSDIRGKSFNLLLVMCDYIPELFNDYDPITVKNVVGINLSATEEKANNTLLPGGRKVHSENMVIVNFDRDKEKITFIPISGSTLVTVKGIQIRLEDVAGEWGIEMLTEKVHALTGLKIDNFAVFTPTNAAKALDLFGEIDYTIKCNMNYKVPERGINIELSAGTYRLDGKKTVEMLRFDNYDALDVTRSEITLGYAKRFLGKLTEDLTSEKLRDIICNIIPLVYTDLDLTRNSEEIILMTECGKLTFDGADVVGNWQTVSGQRYFVLDETKTLEKLSHYRRSSSN